MTQTDLPLYPKISSIYNKILQLACGIVIIVVLMNILLDNYHRQAQVIYAQEQQYGNDYIEQAAYGVILLIKQGKKSQVNDYLEKLTLPAVVRSVTLYDQTGQTIGQAGEATSINVLYGVHSLNQQLDNSSGLKQFVVELRDEKLYGYLRLTVVEHVWQQSLIAANNDSQELMRIMLLLAGLAGFFLTRGLSRFSRQGYRINTNR